MGNNKSKTRPQSRAEKGADPVRRNSSSTVTGSSRAVFGADDPADTAAGDIGRVRHAEYRPLQDPDQTVDKPRFPVRASFNELEEASQLGQESTLRSGHGSTNIHWATGYGLVGLRNLGNTCYMNSMLQCICHSPGFSAEFTDAEQIRAQTNPKSKLRGRLAESFAQLVQRMRAAPDHSVLTPSEVKAQLGRLVPGFSGYGQQDAQEFLRLLLEGLNQDLNRVPARPTYKELKGSGDRAKIAEEWFTYSAKRDDSLVTDYFRGQLMTVTTCGKCKEESVACDTFLDLSLPIPGGHSSVTLEDCLQSFTAKTVVEGFKCEKCRRTSRSQMQMTLWRLPKLLVIHLKRFSSNSWRREKVNTEVKFPNKGLDLTLFTSKTKDGGRKSATYDLFAVSHHVGDLGFGHYFRYCPLSDCLHAGKWHRFDDSNVSRSDVYRARSSAYVLFYARCDST